MILMNSKDENETQ